MNKTYVFDFYNLYIPKGKKYINKDFRIKISPLKFAEEFERNRTKFSKPYYRGGWKTAKCYITSDNVSDAKKIAGWLEFIFSFAQSRSVFFIDWYEYRRGKRYSSYESKRIEPRENRFSELIHGTNTRGAFFTRDISLFIDIALKTLSESKQAKLDEILSTVHAYIISDSEIVEELKFLIGWIALEKLANSHYSAYKSKNMLFNKSELTELKKQLGEFLDSYFDGDNRLGAVKRSLTRNFLYDHNTLIKLKIYFNSIDLGFDEKKLSKMLEKLISVRTGLAHNLISEKLMKDSSLLNYLHKIMQNIIFRLLGIDKDTLSCFVLNQYNRGSGL